MSDPRNQPENFTQVEDTRFWIDTSLANEIQDAVIPLLLKHRDKIPHWCRRVTVYWKEDNGAGAASMTALYEYRRGEMTIGPNFLSLPQRRELNIVHELVHLYVEPLWNAAVDARDAVKETNAAAAAILTEGIRHQGEQAVVDLTELILGIT